MVHQVGRHEQLTLNQLTLMRIVEMVKMDVFLVALMINKQDLIGRLGVAVQRRKGPNFFLSYKMVYVAATISQPQRFSFKIPSVDI